MRFDQRNENHVWSSADDDAFLTNIGALRADEDGNLKPTRAGSGMDKIFGGWEWAGYGEPSYDVAYGPDRTTLTLPLVSADSTGVSTAEGRPKAAESGRNVPRNKPESKGQVV